jgi:trk system potassium uptake protein TrkA
MAVIGLGEFGLQLAKELTLAGAEVIGIDTDRQIIDQNRDEMAIAIRMDSRSKDGLIEQGLSEMDAVVIGIGRDFEAAAMTTVHLCELGVGRIICRAETPTREFILKRIGAHEVVNPEGESARRWAHRLILPKLQDYLEMGDNHSLVQIDAPADFHNRTPAQIQLRQNRELNLVAIRRKKTIGAGQRKSDESPTEILIPRGDTPILPGDVLILIGSNEALAKLGKG